jgi:hypothetical protein
MVWKGVADGSKPKAAGHRVVTQAGMVDDGMSS